MAHRAYKILVKNAKTNSWQKFCSQVIRSNIFTIPYKIALNRIKRPIMIPSIIKPDGTYTQSLADSIKQILEHQFPRDDPSHYTPTQETLVRLVQTPPDSPNDHPFTLMELSHVILNIPERITLGMDNITASLVKNLLSLYPTLLLKLFNGCLKYSYFPDIWKESRAILLPKPDKPTDLPSSYRPICINSIFGKVLEKLLNNRLYHFLHSRKLLHPKQFGFTHNTSATAALVNLKNKLKSAITTDNKTLLISLDISNAFNTIWIPFVLDFFKRNNLPRNLYLLLNAALSDRSITYPLRSSKVTLATSLGSPQGSPLSPLLWNVIISSLLDLPFPENANIQAFADDITLTVSGKTRLQLEMTANSALNLIYNWSTEHHIHFNIDKCKFLLIGRHYIKRPPTIKLGHQNIRHVKELKILGVIFDTSLTFLPHATHLRNQIYKHTIALSSFTGIHWGFSPKHFRDLYHRSLERIITYGAPVFWQTPPHSHLRRKLISIQRIPLLKICKAFHTVSNSNLNILTNILPIEHTLNREIALFHLFHLKIPFSIYGTTYDPSTLQHDIDRWDTHPALLPHFPHSTDDSPPKIPPSTTHRIYTDGSLYLDTVGSAYVIMDKTDNIIHFGKYKLPSFASIYDAKLQAIKQALLYAQSLPDTFSFTLYSDSYSALKAIANPYNTHPTVFNIKQVLQTLTATHSIQLVHIRSHTNIYGNDQPSK